MSELDDVYSRLCRLIDAHGTPPPELPLLALLDQAQAIARDSADARPVAVALVIRAVLDARRAEDAGESISAHLNNVRIAVEILGSVIQSEV